MTAQYVPVSAIQDDAAGRIAPFPLGYDVEGVAARLNAGISAAEAFTWVYTPTVHLFRRIADLEEKNRELTEALESARLNGAMNALGGRS